MNENQPRTSGQPRGGDGGRGSETRTRRRGLVLAGFAGLLLMCVAGAIVGPSGGATFQRLRSVSDAATVRLRQQIAASAGSSDQKLQAASAATPPPPPPPAPAPAPPPVLAPSPAPAPGTREWGLAWQALGPSAPPEGKEIQGNTRLVAALQRKLDFTQAEFDQLYGASTGPLPHNAYIKAGSVYFQPAPLVACDAENQSLPTAADVHVHDLPTAPSGPAAAAVQQHSVSEAVSLAPATPAPGPTPPPNLRAAQVRVRERQRERALFGIFLFTS